MTVPDVVWLIWEEKMCENSVCKCALAAGYACVSVLCFFVCVTRKLWCHCSQRDVNSDIFTSGRRDQGGRHVWIDVIPVCYWFAFMETTILIPRDNAGWGDNYLELINDWEMDRYLQQGLTILKVLHVPWSLAKEKRFDHQYIFSYLLQ